MWEQKTKYRQTGARPVTLVKVYKNDYLCHNEKCRRIETEIVNAEVVFVEEDGLSVQRLDEAALKQFAESYNKRQYEIGRSIEPEGRPAEADSPVKGETLQ